MKELWQYYPFEDIKVEIKRKKIKFIIAVLYHFACIYSLLNCQFYIAFVVVESILNLNNTRRKKEEKESLTLSLLQFFFYIFYVTPAYFFEKLK